MMFKNQGFGMLKVELTSAEVEDALKAIYSNGITVIQLVKINDLACQFWVRQNVYPAITLLCKKMGAHLQIVGRRGIYWTIVNFYKRPVLIFGLCTLILLTFFLPTRVFFVRVEGSESIPQRSIIEAAENCGICFGASRREVRSEKMKNALLSAMPELQWAGINTEGCTAVISVREGDRHAQKEEERIVSSIVAARDGYILAGTVTKGNCFFRIGQVVEEGQLLISGYTDCGFRIQAVRAEGEIMAQTNHRARVVTPSEYLLKRETLNASRKYSLIFRKKRINLWKDSGISDSSCGRMYKEYYATLPGGFRLPLALCIEEYTAYNTEVQTLSFPEAYSQLTEFAGQYVVSQMIAGTIIEQLENVSRKEDFYQLDGQYRCKEMIGREVAEQIGETNGKTD